MTFCLFPLVSDFTRKRVETNELSFGRFDRSGISRIEHVGMVLEEHSWVRYSRKYTLPSSRLKKPY